MKSIITELVLNWFRQRRCLRDVSARVNGRNSFAMLIFYSHAKDVSFIYKLRKLTGENFGVKDTFAQIAEV